MLLVGGNLGTPAVVAIWCISYIGKMTQSVISDLQSSNQNQNVFIKQLTEQVQELRTSILILSERISHAKSFDHD